MHILKDMSLLKILTLFFLTIYSFASFNLRSIDEFPFHDRTQTLYENNVRASASVLGTQDIISFLLSLLFGLPQSALAQEPDLETEDQHVLMKRVQERWTGDLQEIREQRRWVRVLVSYNNTYFFVDRGRLRGLEYELLHQYELFINKGKKRSATKTKIVFLAVPTEGLIQALLEGRGDIAAAGLTITPERKRLVAFTKPYFRDVREIVVSSKTIKTLRGPKDLSGRKIHVVAGTSYIQHLKQINKRLKKDGLRPIDIVQADKTLEEEDILEMINLGIFELTVLDQHLAELWSGVLKNLVLWKDIVIHSGGNIGWAVRKENPALLASLNKFIAKHGQGNLLGNILIKRYFKNTRWIRNPLESSEMQKLEKLKDLFKKYSKKYGFDWLKIAALAYQESGLDQNARSPAGAVGIMQVLPTTAADPIIGIPDINKLENNIHAGIKYLDFIREKYFNNPKISPADKIDFTFAAYNAGPSRIQSLRRRAHKFGVDPNKWFFNVEHVALRLIGREPVRYVENINKYFITYKSAEQILEGKSIQLKKIY